MIEIITPELDEISISRWFITKYNIKQQKEIKTLIDSHVWITAKKEKLFVSSMSTSHIKNCINCWEGNGKMKIPSHYLGGKEKWLKIFNEELLKRN